MNFYVFLMISVSCLEVIKVYITTYSRVLQNVFNIDIMK